MISISQKEFKTSWVMCEKTKRNLVHVELFVGKRK